MLDFIADNYLWFIVLGAVLLAIALILLFTRKNVKCTVPRHD